MPDSHHRLSWIIAGVLACLTAFAGNGAAAQEPESDWEVLFNGKSLEGWTQKNGWATYRVEDGAIVGTTAKGSPNSFLCSVGEYTDFELQFEVKCDNALNSGVQIRSQTKERIGKNEFKFGRVNGPQIEIEASGANGAESGYVYGEATGRGWLVPQDQLVPHQHFRDGQWNHYRVVAQGSRFQTFINGEAVCDLDDPAILKTHPGGFIGLQVHGVGDRGPFEVRWRNIKIRTLD